MKRMNYLKPYLRGQSEFDHLYAAWANNHNGWSKMKKSNKRRAKKAERLEWKKEAYPIGADDG